MTETTATKKMKELTDADRCPECGERLVYGPGPGPTGTDVFCENSLCGLYLGKVEASK